jgi:Fe-S-cluster containining protein
MDNICIDCALCCDGTLFTSVPVDATDEFGPLAASGARLLKIEDRTTFRLPCPAVAGGCCSIYDRRPAICREVSCLLRLRYDAGLVSFDEARSRIASAKELRDRIRPELEGFFGSPGPHAVSELFNLMHAEIDGHASALRERPEHAELLLDVTALRLLIRRHFDPSRWTPEEASRADAGE